MGTGISEYFSWSRWLKGKYPGYFLKLLAEESGWFLLLFVSEFGITMEHKEKHDIQNSFSAQRKAWVQRYNNRADVAETDRGKDAGWKKISGSQAKEPADHITDWQKTTEQSEIQALVKGRPIFCSYLPLEISTDRSSSASALSSDWKESYLV